jgi:hypothetical protein
MEWTGTGSSSSYVGPQVWGGEASRAAASSGIPCGWYSANDIIDAAGEPHFHFTGVVQSSGSASFRVFIGLDDAASASTMVGANDPSANYIGFQHVTNRSAETTWQFARKAGGTQVLDDTGLTVNTSAFVTVEIVYVAPGAVRARIRETSGEWVSPVVTDEIPTVDVGPTALINNHVAPTTGCELKCSSAEIYLRQPIGVYRELS